VQDGRASVTASSPLQHPAAHVRAESRIQRLCIVTELCECDLMKLLLRSPAHRGMHGRTAMAALARQISAAVGFLHAVPISNTCYLDTQGPETAERADCRSREGRDLQAVS
jgi:hypothetical protein